MTVIAQSADGVQHQFPDGTNPAVIDKVMKAYAQQNAPKTSQTLGYEQGVGHFLSNMASAGDYAGRKIGLPMDSIESTLFGGKTLQQAKDIVSNPAHPANVQGGKIGQFIANLQEATPIAMAGGPITGGMLAGAALTDSNNPQGITRDALIGGAAGGLGGYGLRALSKALPAKLVGSVPSTDELRSAASNAYKTADQSGMVISGQSVKNLASKIEIDLANEGFDATLHPGTARALGRITQAADTTNPANGNITLQGMDILRKVAGQVGGANVTNKADAHMAGIVRDNIDQFVQGLKPQDVLGGAVDKGAVDALGNARSLWRTASKSQIIDDAMNRAANDASGYSQSGYENAVRRNFKNLANSKRFNQFTSDEQTAIQKIVAGGPIGNALRRFGKFSPHGVVSAASDVVIGGKLGAVPLMLGGALSKLGATAATERNADMLSAIVRNGGTLPATTSSYAAKLLEKAATPARITGPILAPSIISDDQ